MASISTIRAEILVFKTNLRHKKDLKRIATDIGKEPRIKRWHVDITDIDKVLRIEAVNMKASDIIHLLRQAGYQCNELPDE